MSTCAQRISVVLALVFGLSGCGQIETVPEPKVPKDVLDIIHAVDARDHAQLKSLLDAGATPTPAGSPLSPLHAATTQFSGLRMVCDSESLKLMLDHGADPNFVDEWSGFTPLEDVLASGNLECARLLKAAGADPKRYGHSGSSVLVYAVKGVVYTGDTSILKLVLSWGVDPNDVGDARDGRAYTALQEAAWQAPGEDSTPAVEELLSSGANPCIADQGQTPLDRLINLSRSAAHPAWATASEIAADREESQRSAAMQKLLTDAMSACPPKQSLQQVEKPSLFKRLFER